MSIAFAGFELQKTSYSVFSG